MSLPIINTLSRLGLGWIFLWAFLDKMFGLGFATSTELAWINGGSPTSRFLTNSKGPFAELFQNLSGLIWVDWLFMIGLLLIGLALILGVGMRIATATGSLLLLLMWMSVLPPKTNPFLDSHLIYILILTAMYKTRKDHRWSLAGVWSKTKLVKAHPWLA